MWAGEWGVVGRFGVGVSVGFVINMALWVAGHGYGAGSDCWGVSLALRSG